MLNTIPDTIPDTMPGKAPDKTINLIVQNIILSVMILIVGCCQAFGSSNLINPGPVVNNITDIKGHSTQNITRMLQDSSGFIWLAKYDGLMRYDGYNIKKFQHDKQNPHSLVNNFISAMVEDDQGFIWLATDGGLSRFNPQTEHFDNFTYSKDDNTTLDSDLLFSLSLGADNRLWIGSEHGINLFDRKSLTNQRLNSALLPGDENQLEDVHHILEDSQQTLWFSVEKKGLYQHNLSSQTTRHFQKDDNNGLFSTAVSRIVQTPNGQLLVGTHQGLNRFDPAKQQFDPIIIEPKQQNGSGDIRVESIIQDNQNRLWIGTLYNGVNVLQPGQHQAVAINQGAEQNNPFPQSLDASHISDILQDASGSIWFATLTKGLYRLSPEALLFKHYQFKDNTPADIQNLYPDDHTIISPAAQTWDAKMLQPLQKYRVTSLLSAGNYTIAGTAINGLRVFDKTRGLWSKVSDDHHDIRQIWHLYQDNQQRIWVATDASGLAQLDLSDLTLTFIDSSDGLPSNSVSSIIADNTGVLWLGTADGIVRYEPNSSQITTFNRNHGLRVDAFEPAKSAISSNGDIFMLSNRTVVSFSPSQLNAASLEKTAEQPLLLSDFRLFNQPTQLRQFDPLSPLTHTINATQALTLSHQQNWFSLTFASSNTAELDKVRYAYKMEGLSDQWIVTDKGNRSATFTALPANHYILKIRASDADGRWNNHHRAINITVTPPQWQTWQAYLLYIALTIGSIWAVYHYRTQSLVKMAAMLEQKVADRTAKVNHLMAQKEQLFANISHEFKTPLTLVLVPLASLLTSLEPLIPAKLANEVSRKKSMMLRNGQRLLRMIDQLLELSELESGQAQTDCHYSLKETLEVLLIAFQPLLDNKNLSLQCLAFKDAIVTLKADALEIILTNLISNAIKYTPKNGKITITVVNNPDTVSLSVTDSGIGISPEDQQIVFNRFTRASGIHTENIPGAGIGLALVRELVNRHQGSIELTSVIDQGSTFIVTLPINHDAVIEGKSQGEDSTQAKISPSSQTEIDSLAAKPTDLSDILNDNDQDQSTQSGETVLLIDDNADMLDLLADTLRPRYHCLSAQDGEKGLLLAQQQLPDLIISDVMMPGIQGFEVVKQLKQTEVTSHIPVILLSAKGDLPSRLQGWSEDADEYLVKPFNQSELLMRVANLLSIRRLLQQRYQREFFQTKESPQDEAKEPPLAHQQFFDKLNNSLEKHYADEDFDVATLVSEMHLSHRQLSRKMRTLMDLTPNESIRNFRLKKAADRLNQGVPASDVALQVGFTSHSYFSKCFKAQYNCAPSHFLSTHLSTQ